MSITDLRDPPHARTNRVLWLVFDERRRQDAKFGDQTHLPNGTGKGMYAKYEIPNVERAQFLCEASKLMGKVTWAHVLVEEVCEAIDEECNSDPERLKEELIQIAAVAVAWVEAIEKRSEK